MTGTTLEASTAISEISAIVKAEAIQQLIQAQTNGTAVAIPDDVKIQDLEAYLEHRRRYRGRMKTILLEEFCTFVKCTTDDYSNTYGEDSVDFYPCFVDPEDMTAQVFFNLGPLHEPGHGDHTAGLRLKKTNAYEELLKINGRKFGQRELAEWLEDWRDMTEATDEGGSILTISAATAAIRRITIGASSETTREEQTFGSKQSAMAQIEAKNKDQLPAFLHFTCEPYQGLDQKTFVLRLNIITGEKPQIGARIVRLESAQEEMAKEFEEKIRDGLEDTAVKTFVGFFAP